MSQANAATQISHSKFNILNIIKAGIVAGAFHQIWQSLETNNMIKSLS